MICSSQAATAAPSDTARGASLDVAALRVALIGYGEVGAIFGAALIGAGVSAVRAFDVLIADPSWTAKAAARAARDVVLATSAADAIAGADLVICAVTAAETKRAAEAIARACRRDAFVLDVNSASPQTKTACAEIMARVGAHYVEAAVMSSVPPFGIRVPMLLGGPHARAVHPLLARLGFEASVGSERYGVVSAIKLCRSVVVKGMEALAIESLLAARRYGVECEVLASLAETFPGLEWERQATWFWRRVMQHGRRRAEEMHEAAVTIADAGFTPRMATATADVQSWIAALRSQGVFATAGADPAWRELADSIPRSGDDDAADRAQPPE